ncbi:phosphoglycerate dehydrogenase [Rhodoflexus caldus]|uniref:phosphoglycerate dehydrogenase n=1 Tax=Rhodoflexus caldus TaxID=2891236 RepID=UPI00202AAC8C|nr:phosphoglycerate dehydrogenase [Rhodoflexus caldus]
MAAAETKYFILDFDSTFTKVEALDELAGIALDGSPLREQIVEQIADLTNRGMDGSISFRESLEKRVALLNANRSHLERLIASLKAKVSDSVKRNRAFFETYADTILIISSGFKEFIVPVVSEYGIKPENVYANEFLFDDKGNIIGFRDDIPLAHNNGKVTQLAELNLQGEVYVIGDGYTDYEMRKAGLANSFYAFTENVVRESVTGIADHVTPSLDEFLYVNKLPMAISYPKSRINVLILENIHSEATHIFKEEGYNVEIINSALDENELCEKIKDISILCIRSKTNVTRKVIEHANKLMAIGAFCIGTNQIDLEACLEKGIAVFNAPYSNTRSVVELAIGEIIMLMRNMPDKVAGMHQGKWDKSATGSYEVRGKKLGIIGYGNIGSQLSVVAEALGMDVYFYDIVDRLAIGKAQKCRSLRELLNLADIVSLHVDGRKQNRNLIGAAEFAEMKDGVIFINLARGEVVDVDALVNALQTGKVRGAAVDVFPKEPKNNKEEFVSPLRGMKNVLLTPHIGGSTMEAQINIAQFVPGKLIEYINTGNTFMSVNFPNIQLPVLENAHRLIHIHKNVSGILAQINNVLARHQINIVGQYLKTSEKVGYVITDIDKAYNKEVIKDLKAIENTIKFRVLY